MVKNQSHVYILFYNISIKLFSIDTSNIFEDLFAQSPRGNINGSGFLYYLGVIKFFT